MPNSPQSSPSLPPRRLAGESAGTFLRRVDEWNRQNPYLEVPYPLASQEPAYVRHFINYGELPASTATDADHSNWTNIDNMDEEQKAKRKYVFKPKLFKLIRKIKADKATYLGDRGAEVWQKLSKELTTLTNKRMRSFQTPKTYRYDNLTNNPTRMAGVYQQNLEAHIQTVVSKALGFPIRKLTRRQYDRDLYWAPQKWLKSWNSPRGFLWMFADYWDQNQKAGYVKWCPVDKNWWWYEHMMQLYDYKNNALVVTEVSINVKNEQCPVCSKKWIPGNHFYSPVTELKSCRLCSTDKKDNPRPTRPEGIVSSYHSHRLGSWQFQIQRTGDPQDGDTLPMGIEVEVQPMNTISPGIWAFEVFKHQVSCNPEWNNIYFERDGSLGEGGVECITNPMTLLFHKEYWEKMLPFMRKNARGWNLQDTKTGAERHSYGIHITSNRKYWGDLGIARLQQFMLYEGNYNFAKAIAQRNHNYNSVMAGGYKKEQIRIKNFHEFDDKTKKMTANNRRGHVNVKGELIEIRAFASTLNQESFMKNLEFVDSFRNYVRETPYNIEYQVYLKWLMSRASHLKKYNNLISYLHRKKFPVKNASVSIENVWLDLLKFRPQYLKKPVEFTPTLTADVGLDPETE